MRKLLGVPYPIIIIPIIIAVIAIVAGGASLVFGAQTDQEVFNWTIGEFGKNHNMSIHSMSMPKIEYVSREKFREIFLKGSEKDYIERWVPKLGKKRADWIREYYSNSAIGLYLPKSMKDPEEIYILDTLNSCERKAFLAHEFTHYLQDVIYGEIDLDSTDADRQNAFREIESRRFENKYRYEFCH